MSPRSKKQNEEIKENKRRLIIETALEHFALHGYYPTTIEHIAKHAGISKGLVYNYFESKEQLLKTIMLEGIQEMFSSFDPDHDGILTSTELDFYIHETFGMIKKNRQFWVFFFATFVQPSVYKLAEPEMEIFAAPLMNILQNYFKEKFGENFQNELTIFLSLAKGALISYVYAPEQFDIDFIENYLIKKYSK